jgi:glucosylceramidase
MRSANPNLKVVGTAWSAPGWFKKDNKATTRLGLIGGTLNDTLTDSYADYLSRVVTAYTIRDVPFDAITMQNEPAFSPSNYAGMLLSAEQEASLAIACGKKFAAKGLKTKLLVHDHNWDIA